MGMMRPALRLRLFSPEPERGDDSLEVSQQYPVMRVSLK